MPRERLSMRKIKDVLRLKQAGLSNRAVARACSIGKETVREYLARAAEAGLGWPLPEGLGEDELERKLFPYELHLGGKRKEPDWSEIHKELRKKGVTRRLLWMEYVEGQTDVYRYTQFCERYTRWAKTLHPTMRLTHKAGEKLFVDYAGLSMSYQDRATGEAHAAPVFVSTLGASSATFCEAHASQALPCWIGGHVHAFEYFGGVPEAVVPDNAKTGVTSACFYEPDLNPTYQDMAQYYGTAVLPTRVRHPRDKAKVETGVQVVERWVIAPLRHRTFFSLEEINLAIAEKREELNLRTMEHLGKSRRELFESLDRPALRPLPGSPYEPAEWKRARVGIDYHIQYQRHYYSVPYELRHKDVELRVTEQTIEVFYRGRRVASHLRDATPGYHTTLPEHMPASHRASLEWTPDRFLRWAEKAGPATSEMVRTLLVSRAHPEQGYRAALGLMRLGSRYGQERLEDACRRALRFGLHSYRGVKNILEAGLDRIRPDEESVPRAETLHPNIRGTDYYS
jgi:transposase